ncbi:MAG: D-2-hydroxyacid dehydrogenase family protein [Alphaproteobacteria bacterium]|nr:MAG: D-2-hydroxyacid dehydrogenase family protein [Alphaproteobacteria bacterium]
MRVHILDDWFDTLRHLPCFSLLKGHEVTVWTDHEPDPAKLAARLRDAEALVLFRERTPITAELLDRLPRLRLISMRGAWPHVDVEACTARGVVFSSKLPGNAPNYAAAELTIALILASLRQIPEQVTSARAGHWQAGVGRTARGKRLGVWGYGRIGRAVAGMAEALGMEVQVWGSEAGRARAAAEGRAVAHSREAFLDSADIVSLHLRLVPATRGLVTAGDLARMRDGALFVNTSRAGLVEPGALEAEIARGRIHAAVDVFPEEPLTDPSHPLLASPNVLPTPHIGFVTEEEFDLQFADAFAQVNAFAAGHPINVVNPDALRRQAARPPARRE